jgi:DNA-binding NarL/FixJ family response regulator
MHSNAVSSDPTEGLQLPIGIVVIDDQLAVREGVSRLLACAQLSLRAVGTAATGAEALGMVAVLRPEVVVLDADLDGEDGLALIPQLSRTAGVLVLTSHGDAATRNRATLLGALAFVEKHEPAAELLACVVRIAHLQMRGEKALGPSGTNDHPSVAASSLATPRLHP